MMRATRLGSPCSRRAVLRLSLAAAGGLAAAALLQACGGAAAPTTAPAAKPTEAGAPKPAAAAPTTAPTPAAAPAAATKPAASPTAAAAATKPAAAASPTAPAKPTEPPKPAAAATPQGYTSQGAKGQIQLYYWADVNDFFKKLIDQFSQETGLGVKYDVAPGDYITWQQLITTRLASGYTDLDTFHSDDFQTAIYGAAGWLEPLDPVVKSNNLDLSDWPKTLLTDVSAWEGKLYRIPWGNDTEIVFYRTDFFKEAGVEPPKDWKQLLEVTTKLTKEPDRYGIALSGKKGGLLGNDIQHWSHQAGGAINKLDHPGSMEAITFYKDLFKKHKVAPPSTPQDDYGAVLQGFLNNKFAIWWCWDGFLGAMRQNKDFWKDQVSAFLPMQGPANNQTVTGCWGWSISALSKKKDQAAQWVAFTARAEVMKQQMFRGRVPARISLWSDKDVQKNAPSAPFLEQLAKAGDRVKARPVTPVIQEIYDAAEEPISAYLTDQIDLNTAVQQGMTKIKQVEARGAKR
jgi:ABC-type glycerol-3-phosphate transport system substrate-binding protein